AEPKPRQRRSLAWTKRATDRACCNGCGQVIREGAQEGLISPAESAAILPHQLDQFGTGRDTTTISPALLSRWPHMLAGGGTNSCTPRKSGRQARRYRQ